MQEAREILATGRGESDGSRWGAGGWGTRHLLLGTVGLVAIAIASYYVKGLLFPSPGAAILKGDALHRKGEHAAAIAAYRRALEGSSNREKIAALERIVRCARESGDDAGLLTAAIELLAFDSQAWFGDRNLAVARAVIDREVSLPANPELGRPHAVTTTVLAAERLRFAIAGPGIAPEEKEQAREQLAKLCSGAKLLPEGAFEDGPMSHAPMSVATDDLIAKSNDESLHPSLRARGAYLAGLVFDAAGSSDEALAQFRRALELTSINGFIYFGLIQAPDDLRPRSLRGEPELQQMVRQFAWKVRRLDPSVPDMLRGGLRFHLGEPELRPELGPLATITLRRISADSSTVEKDSQAVGLMNGDVPFQLDRTAWIGVIDGRYRLEIKMGRRTTEVPGLLGASLGQQYQLLEFDTSAVPAEVEIRGETIDLPPIRPYFLTEIAFQSPDEGAVVDPGTTEFRWAPIEGATRYEVDMAGSIPTRGGTILRSFTAHSIGSPVFTIDQLSSEEAKALRSQPAGAEGSWQVRAYDARGLLVGKTLNARKIVVPGFARKAPR